MSQYNEPATTIIIPTIRAAIVPFKSKILKNKDITNNIARIAVADTIYDMSI